MIKKILLVEDDADDQLIFKDALRSVDPKIICETAPNGKVALDHLKATPKENHPQLTFLDLNMPVMDGVTFLSQVKLNPAMKHLPIGVLSTSSVLADMKTTKALGARFFLTKPNDFATLCRHLSKIIAYDYSKGDYLIVI